MSLEGSTSPLAMVPKNNFLEIVNFLGGLESVYTDKEKKESIARLFNVETKLVSVRIYDLLTREKDKKEVKKLSLSNNE